MSEYSIRSIINNYDCLNTFLQNQVNSVSLGTTAKDFLLLSTAIDNISEHRQVSVASSTQLPNINSNNISNGQIIFIEDSLVPVVANNECWVGLDGRVLLSDAPSRCLFTWGSGAVGQLGNGTTTDRCSPGTVAGGGTNWKFISNTSNNSSMAIKTDGTLWTWGNNTSGKLGDGTTVSRCSPGTVAGGGTNWCQASGGFCHSAAIKTDGTLWTWGSSGFGLLGDGTGSPRCSPGTVAGGGTNWCQSSSMSQSTAAIKTDGTLWTWGCNGQGRLGDGTTTNRCSPGTVAGGGTTWCFVASSSSAAMLAIKTDGTLWTWGCNSQGVLGDGTTVSRCSPGTVAGGGTTWCQGAIGSGLAAAIKTDGTLWTWGSGVSSGGLGTGFSGININASRSSPGTVAGGGTNWCKVSVVANNDGMGAIKTDGTLWTWGNNAQGQLGDGTTTNRCSPGTIAGGGTNWIDIADTCNKFVALTLQ